MKRFFLNLLLFCGLLLIIYPIILIASATILPKGLRGNLPYNLGGNGHSFSRFKDADTTKNVDIMVLGSSHAYRGYDPRIFKTYGLKMFNLGSSAQSPIQTNYLLNKYYKKLNPKLVIIDVYPSLFNTDGVESTADLISNTQIDQKLINMSLVDNDISLYNTLLYSYFRQKFHLNNHFKESVFKNKDDQYIPGGYVQSFQEFKSEKSYKKGHYVLSKKQLSAFEQMIEFLKKENQPYVIIQAPIPVKMYNRIDNNTEVDKVFSKFGTYMNSNELVSLPDSCFYDGSHLNQKGVKIFNEKIINILKEKVVVKGQLSLLVK